MSYGEKLGKLMKEHGIKQETIAREAGVSRAAVSAVVRGESRSRRLERIIQKELVKAGIDVRPDEPNPVVKVPSVVQGLDPEIGGGPWKPLGSYEVNIYGVVRKARKTKGTVEVGQLMKPSRRSGRKEMIYSLTLDGKNCTMRASKMVQQAHGREIRSNDGVYEKILAAIQATGRKGIQREMRHIGNLKVKKRRCHDCGRPTNNYRCDKCWARLRAQNTDCSEIDFGCRLAL